MLRPILLIITFLISAERLSAREPAVVADSIRRAFHIPGLCYAVVTADSILEMRALGESKINSGRALSLGHKFRLGSNTKVITGYIAACLVHQQKIKWDTRFFDLFPELRAKTRTDYLNYSLLDLLTFRTRLYPYTYTDPLPDPQTIFGSPEQQRRQFMEWIFDHQPIQKEDSVSFSNPGYVAAAMMLEKAAGTSYENLVTELSRHLSIDLAFGPPNLADSLQTWGHDKNSVPEQRGNNPKLNWLQPAGNLNANLPDYLKFVQLNLSGLQRGSHELSAAEFSFLHFGRPRFAVGWFISTSDPENMYTWHTGNPGSYLTKTRIYNKQSFAIVIFTNIQSEAADTGTELLLNYLQTTYQNH